MKEMKTSENLAAQILDDCRVMLRYAKTEGKTLDEATNDLIASVESLLHSQGDSLAGDSRISSKTGESPTAEQRISSAEPATLLPSLLKLHVMLASIAAPATPVSLRATESERSFFGSLGNPPLMLWMTGLSLFFLLGYLFSLPFSQTPDQGPRQRAGSQSTNVTITNTPATTQKP